MPEFSDEILHWYDSNGRDLPWRQTSNPYLIWLSEIILQQTRVEQGLEYYRHFIERFPTLHSLAEADEDEVLRYWQGLGYYSRARNLHQAAISMNGSFPIIYNKVLALKGVGTYTAAAICSIAYNQSYAVVDGNVYRVLSRYFGINTPIDTTSGKKEFAQLAQSLLNISYPGRYNQAIMDFGAIQCTPASPKCIDCPLVDSCIAYSKGIVAELPIKSRQTKISNRYFNYLFVHNSSSLWLQKRTAKDIWHNLYELPLIETTEAIDETQLLANNSFQKMMIGLGSSLTLSHKERVKHILSHRIIYADFYEIAVDKSVIKDERYLTIPTIEWQHYALPQLVYRFLEKRLP